MRWSCGSGIDELGISMEGLSQGRAEHGGLEDTLGGVKTWLCEAGCRGTEQGAVGEIEVGLQDKASCDVAGLGK